MNSRERVLTALSHQEPDRVPLFIGTSGVTTLLGPAYENLKNHLGLHGRPPQWISKPMQYARLEEDVLVRLGSDGRMIAPGPAPSPLARAVSEDCIVDSWGVAWERSPGCLYYEVRRPPLAEATIDDLARYPWPDLLAPSRFEGLAAQAKAVQQA
ncbi:MAG: hypothetical protein PHU85_04735, partial [Phycisphaerae bacterium]|nr:hypothetical protein [Phycisphaerae bacterium]